MQLFQNDYNVMCHPSILKRMLECSNEQNPGYGTDHHCARATDKIKKLCQNDNLAVHFLVGGTQTNLIVIAAALRPFQGVIGAVSAHINVHETGAIEATGHKVIALPSDDGKITAQQVEKIVNEQAQSDDAEHIVQPKMVYISNSTEMGTVYTLAELESLSATCRKLGLYLFMDGARLGYALAAQNNDITMSDIARLCDVFYIGGTKVGAMFGEAVVISNPAIAADFRYMIKQRGGLLAKGWLIGMQFDVLMENDLYFEIAGHANQLADQLRNTLKECGYPMIVHSDTNQIFTVLPRDVLNTLSGEICYSAMEWTDEEHRVVRFCTSWASTQDSVDELCNRIRQISN